MTHVSNFRIGYELDNDQIWTNTLNDASRESVRQDLCSHIHPLFTHKTSFHAFADHPDYSDMIQYINDYILGPEDATTNPKGVVVSTNPLENKHNQEHVWVNGVWVCESRFRLNEGGDPYTETATVMQDSNSYTFTATYFISVFNYHDTP